MIFIHVNSLSWYLQMLALYNAKKADICSHYWGLRHEMKNCSLMRNMGSELKGTLKYEYSKLTATTTKKH